MGARLSVNNNRASTTKLFEVSQSEACKRQRASSSFLDEDSKLIPCLPDEISFQILVRLPRISHFNAKLVSRSWKVALSSGKLSKLRKELGITQEWLYILKRRSITQF